MQIIKHEIKPPSFSDENTRKVVSEILAEVKAKGDLAIKQYTQKFDGVKLEGLRLTQDEIDKMLRGLDSDVKHLIEVNARRIRRFAEFQLSMYKNMELKLDGGGTILGQKIIPLDSVGAYVPGGRYPLLSSPLMTIIPAKVAGVRRILATTPPGHDRPHPATLYGMMIAGATNIYTIGGAQAIAAMAYGSESVPRVDKIVGPGNRVVNEAKRQLFGEVGVDLLAGPSEVLVFADESARLEYVVLDLLAQAEHDPDARACLVTTSQELAKEVQRNIDLYIEKLDTREVLRVSWQNHGSIVIADSIQEGIEYINKYAPEHLELHLKKANLKKAFRDLRNYGSIFLGEDTPVVFSDKLIGTNHTLPTGGTARFSGGLSVGAYLKIVTYQRVSNLKSLRYLARRASTQSRIEHLAGHAASAEARL